MSASISSVAQLVSAIRSQLGAASVVAQANQRNQTSAPKTSHYHPENLEGLIKQRIKQIGRDDQERGKKAFRVFLEAVLLSQLGEHLINDPKFYQVLDEVQKTMETNPHTRQLVDQATQHLLNPV
ncbi:MAG: hypothetical protein RL748_681 [Pseudomonadota bacterium]|jgi:hypothetical protein